MQPGVPGSWAVGEQRFTTLCRFYPLGIEAGKIIGCYPGGEGETYRSLLRFGGKQVFLQKVLEDTAGRTFRSAGNTGGFPARNLPAQHGFSQQIPCFRLQLSQARLSIDISGN